MRNKKFPKIFKLIAAILTFVLLVSVFYYFITPQNKDKHQQEMLSSFFLKVKNKSIYEATFRGNEKVEYTTYDEQYFVTYMPQGLKDKVITILNKNGVNITYIPQKVSEGRSKWLDILLDIAIFIFFIILMRSQGSGLGNIMKSSSSSPVIQNNVKFSDVAGIDEFRLDLEEIVDFLKNPNMYKSRGVKIPRGVLLVGQPGTGKTLIAKAVAGEANVAFFAVTGSDFVEMFVGVGAARIRALFETAKKNAPAIIFIDEIDAVGQKRNQQYGGSQEHSNTLVALLSLMDGFHDSEVIVIAATNRVDVLDAALLRPGRFDRIINVPLPDVHGRNAILKLIFSKLKVRYFLDSFEIARMTMNFSGAQLVNLINEALFLVVRKRLEVLTQREVEEAFTKVLFGIGKSREYDLYDKILTAYHEAGHAFIAHELRQFKQYKIFKLTIINHGDALGFLAYLPKDEKIHTTKENILANIKTALGGRAAEEIFFGKDKITTGATSDLDTATQYAYMMTSRFGMTNKGKFSMDINNNQLFSESMKDTIYQTTNEILDESYTEVLKILKKNMTIIHRLVYFLMKYETLYKDDIENIIAGKFDYVGKNCSLQIEKQDLSPFENPKIVF